jgi:hypothetical protein
MTKNQKIKRLQKAHKILKEIDAGSPEVNGLIDSCYPPWYDHISIAMGSILGSIYELREEK